MGVDFKKLMDGKSDQDLQKYFDNHISYTPEAFEYAIAEMQKRGRIFSDEELIGIRQEMQLKKKAEETEEQKVWRSNANVVTDENAPAYYSQKATYGFAVVFGVLFSAVLLAINVKTTESKKGVWQVIAFGITYTAFQIWILSLLPENILHGSATTMFNIVGGVIMNSLFWRKYIGKDAKYRTKPIWKPLIIGLIICIPLVLAVIYGRA